MMAVLRKLTFLLGLVTIMWGCRGEPAYYEPGRLLAEQYCANCHQLPVPEELSRELWVTEVLPKMGAMHGIYAGRSREDYLENPLEARFLQHVYPTERSIDSADWAAIQRYYIEGSPDRLTVPERGPDVYELAQFTVRPVSDGMADQLTPLTTMVAFDERNDRILAGGRAGGQGILRRFTAGHRLIDRQPLHSTPAAYEPTAGKLVQMGSLTPSDVPLGRLTVLQDSGLGPPLLDSLLRPVDVLQIDLDLDGRAETVVAEFGNLTGRLRAYREDGSHRTLSATPGAFRLQKADLDGDGNDDLFVLFAQGDERIEVYLARTGGATRKLLYRFPPSYGSSALRVVDFDGDGDLDLLHANGDNYDYQPVPKPYHGLRLLENDGSGRFSEVWFYYLDGAYGVEVADFDGDGDQDIAAIAYFVPPAKRSVYSFVYLEQESPLRFKPHGMYKGKDQYFICMAKADVDRDGDEDLVLGNFAGYLPDGGLGGLRVARDAPAYFFLENVGRK